MDWLSIIGFGKNVAQSWQVPDQSVKLVSNEVKLISLVFLKKNELSTIITYSMLIQVDQKDCHINLYPTYPHLGSQQTWVLAKNNKQKAKPYSTNT